MEVSIERIKATLQEVLQQLENLAPLQIMHQKHQNSFKIEGSEAFVGLDYIKLGEIIKKEGSKFKKGGDMSKITKNPIKESKITTMNLKIRALLMMNGKKRQQIIII